jgi:hypothetical protein
LNTKREERTGTGGLIPLFEDQENFGIREARIGTRGKAWRDPDNPHFSMVEEEGTRKT